MQLCIPNLINRIIKIMCVSVQTQKALKGDGPQVGKVYLDQ